MKTRYPDWQDYLEWSEGRPGTVVGDLRVLPHLYSAQLHNRRDVLALLPPSYAEAEDRRYPVLYMHDGQNLFDRHIGFGGQEWEVDETMQSLAAEGLEAIVIGLTNTPQRFQEYNPFAGAWKGRGADYLRFIAQTVKPLIDSAFRTLPDRDHTLLFGSSMGGLISLYGFLAYPEIFGRVGAMSPSLWVGSGAIYHEIDTQPFIPGRIYLDNGTREPSARRLKTHLVQKGYVLEQDLRYVVETGGEHHEPAWARRLPDALRFLLSG
ncbi:MAG: alpha/beta hydrolase [Anaerolineae bacterium]|nr:alpha/beta hydrolase [Anaerolineae bacterium]